MFETQKKLVSIRSILGSAFKMVISRLIRAPISQAGDYLGSLFERELGGILARHQRPEVVSGAACRYGPPRSGAGARAVKPERAAAVGRSHGAVSVTNDAASGGL